MLVCLFAFDTKSLLQEGIGSQVVRFPFPFAGVSDSWFEPDTLVAWGFVRGSSLTIVLPFFRASSLAILMIPLAMMQCWKVQAGPAVQEGMCSSTAFMLGQCGFSQAVGGAPSSAASRSLLRQELACCRSSRASIRAVSRSRAERPVVLEGGRGCTMGAPRGGLTPPPPGPRMKDEERRGLGGGLWWIGGRELNPRNPLDIDSGS